jgi:hypothetical protein
MEKLSHIDKYVGLPAQYKSNASAWEDYIGELYAIGKEQLPGEQEKTEREIVLIKFAKDAVDEVLKKYGKREIYDVPLDHIHVFEKGGVEKFTEQRLGSGAHSTTRGTVLADRSDSEVYFSTVLFHELCHAKKYNAVQIIPANKSKTEKAEIENYREGIIITSRDGKQRYFENFEEAIEGLLTQRFYEEKIKTSELFKEEVSRIENEQRKINTSRPKELEDLNRIINYIYEQNKTEFKTRNDVVDVFVEASVNGDLFRLARLVEKTFGKGSFRELGKGTGSNNKESDKNKQTDMFDEEINENN